MRVIRSFLRNGLYAGQRPLRAVLALVLIAALSGCGVGETPREARVLAPEPAMADLGDGYLARYTLLPTLALGEAMARQYGIPRRDGDALLLVAVRRTGSDGEQPARPASVQARVRDLSGRIQTLNLRSVGTGDYVDHVGIVAISRHDTLRLEVEIAIDGGQRRFRFERAF